MGENSRKSLRYGENPQQKAWWAQTSEWGLHQARILQGKELSYNNILDLDAAVSALSLFEEPTVVSVKHNNPCGVASHSHIGSALKHSLAADPVSVFGGIIALNRELDEECASQLVGLFLECIIAPRITDEAKQVLGKKANLRVLEWEQMLESATDQSLRQKSVIGGLLEQTSDEVQNNISDWEVVCGELADDDWKALRFAWKVCASLKSNAIAISDQSQSLGLGMGQVNRVDAVEQAFHRAKNFHPANTNLYLASDAFFPFPDSIELAHKHGAKAIIQPGGSVKDSEVIEKAKELNIPMVFTGRRHFKH